jgi:hypothetical protein
LLFPDEIVRRLRRTWPERRRRELRGDAEWPLRIALGSPTEADAAAAMGTFRDWTAAWERWPAPGDVEWEERTWARIGRQRLPRRFVVGSALRCAEIVGSAQDWQRVVARRDLVRRDLPAAVGDAVFAPWHEQVGALSDGDFTRLIAVVSWLIAPREGPVQLRELPIPGVHTKWIEAHEALVREWVAAAKGIDPAAGTAAVCGLAEPPATLRLRLLAPELRDAVGGLRDVEAPVAQLAELRLRPRGVLVVENLASARAFGDVPGIAVVAGLGAGVSLLTQLGWAREVPWGYWGDLDTHGFAILERARTIHASTESLLMDVATLLRHRELWGMEPRQHTSDLERLTSDEREVYSGLREHRWGDRVRLEQERIDWRLAVTTVHSWARSI